VARHTWSIMSDEFASENISENVSGTPEVSETPDTAELFIDAAEEAPAAEEAAGTPDAEQAEEPEQAEEDSLAAAAAALGDTSEGDSEAEYRRRLREYTRELKKQPGDWYIIQCYSGYENKVKTNLDMRAQT